MLTATEEGPGPLHIVLPMIGLAAAAVVRLARSEPAQSCVVCAGREGRGTPIGWREVKDPSDWVEASAGA